MPRRPYHHGDLRAALLAAADAELTEAGPDRFTLRGCARRAGVSHSAPATFFPDVSALLSEVAASAFEELTADLIAASNGIGDPLARIIAAGRAYALFAVRRPQHFRLMWVNERLDKSNTHLVAAARACFAVPVGYIASLYGHPDPMGDPILAARVIALWSMIHGAAALLISGQLDASGLGSREAIAEVVIPPMLAEHFGPIGSQP